MHTVYARIAAILIPQVARASGLIHLLWRHPSCAPWQIAFNFSALFTQATPELIARYPPSGRYLIAGHLNRPSPPPPESPRLHPPFPGRQFTLAETPQGCDVRSKPMIIDADRRGSLRKGSVLASNEGGRRRVSVCWRNTVIFDCLN